MTQTIYVLYHKMCMDGFGGAYAAWKSLGDSAIYIPVQYGEAIPEMADNSTVYMIDISFSREQLINLNKRMKKLTVIDHHESAETDCKDLEFCIFNIKKSGAMLAWEFFHPTTKPPYYIKYIQDRDLWKWKLKDSQEISLGIYSLPYEFSIWEEKIPKKLNIKKTGFAIKDYQNKILSELNSHVMLIKFEGFSGIPCVNSPVLPSEICQSMLDKYQTPFCLSYYINANGQVKWSIRGSKSKDFNTIPLAEKHGGGGHRGASGFTTSLEFLTQVLKPSC